MALLTKAQVRTAVAQAIDDPQNKRWTSANLDVLITLVQDTMFESVIDTFEYLTSQTDLVTPASGIYTLSGLTKRLYRIQQVLKVSDSSEYQPKLFPETVPQAAYHIIGGTLVTVPSIGSTASSLSIRYSYLPTRFTDLSTDNTTLPVEYPEGHESALIYLSAAWALSKGDAESIQQVGRIADQSLDSLLAHIARLYPIGANARVQQVKMTLMRNPLIGSMVQPNAQ